MQISTCYGSSVQVPNSFSSRLLNLAMRTGIVIKNYYGDDHEYQKWTQSEIMPEQESKKSASFVTICKLVYILKT